MVICKKCKVRMEHRLSGTVVASSYDAISYHGYSGDVYGCPICDFEVVVDFGEKIKDLTKFEIDIELKD